MTPQGAPRPRGLLGRLRRRWRERDPVTICVPAYNSADVIGETLQSIASQTYRNIRVLISLDPSTDGTDKTCEPFLADPRFRLIRQQARLGWPDNVNWLLDQVRTGYYCIIFHDDAVDADYVARLMRCLRKAPDILCAYPLLKHFGRTPSETHIAGLGDGCFERALAFFSQPLNSVPLRGLTRIEALRRGLRLREMGTGGYLAETLYVFELALLGRSKREKRTSYHSRYRPGSVSKGWQTWSDDRKRAAWRRLLREMNALIVRQDFTGEQRRMLLDAALPWAYQLATWLPADAAEKAAIADPARRASLTRAWLADPDGNPPLL
ncbi:MAG TPA: glycosyltransferase family 2 protein [Dongiaceae bacterium]|nr:glycosyltransferase family 2 protein [Dongiaceae bacterium]